VWLIGLVLATPGLAASTGQQRALLELSVNGVNRGVALVVLRGDDLWLESDALARAGLRTPGGDREIMDGREFVRIASLAPRIAATFDERALSLDLTADPELLGRTVVELAAVRPRDIEYRSDTSGFLNYGVNWTSNAQRSATMEGGFRAGAAQVSALVSHNSLTGTWRGPTSVSFDRRDRLQRWTAGDVIVSTGPLGGALAVGGASVSRDYDLDPYFVRYPTVGLSGAVNAPATLDVYVNGRLVRQEQLPPGTFTLNDVPVPAGAGSARVVLRDAFGREQEIGGTFYVTTALLGRGLQQYQYVAGAERLEPAYRSWDYGRPVLLATHRVGVTDDLTLGGRFETSSTLTSGGPQAVARVGRFGEIEGALALSRGPRGTGTAWSGSYLFVGRNFSAGAAWRSSEEAYGTVSDLSAPIRARLATDAGAMFSTRLGSRASTTLTWQHQRYHDVVPRVDALSMTTTFQVSGASELYATISQTRSGSDRRPGVFVGLTTAVGRRVRAGASVERLDGQSVVAADAQRSLPIGEGYGYRVRAAGGHAGSLEADGQYQSRFGRYEIRQTAVEGASATALWASGSIVGIGGRLFATRPVEQSFALVRVPGASNVRTYISNQEVGRTDGRGDLLVPSLLPYYGNLLSIADEDVPLAMTIRRRTLTIAPPAGGGALALFPVSRDRRVMGRVEILDHGATLVPAYGRLVVSLGGTTIESPVGGGGEFYLEGIEPGAHPATVEHDDVPCSFTLVVPDDGSPVTRLGLVRCLAP
jgi:outer membrane usher protein